MPLFDTSILIHNGQVPEGRRVNAKFPMAADFVEPGIDEVEKVEVAQGYQESDTLSLYLEANTKAHEALGDRGISDVPLSDPYWELANKARALYHKHLSKDS